MPIFNWLKATLENQKLDRLVSPISSTHKFCIAISAQVTYQLGSTRTSNKAIKNTNIQQNLHLHTFFICFQFVKASRFTLIQKSSVLSNFRYRICLMQRETNQRSSYDKIVSCVQIRSPSNTNLSNLAHHQFTVRIYITWHTS